MNAPRTVVLVEGDSDRVALQTLAARYGRDLTAEGFDVLAMGGITNVRAYATRFGPYGRGLSLAGLYDAPEEAKLRRGLTAAGIDASDEAAPLATLGFFACTADLEDELIRALGVDGVEAVIDAAGETSSLRRLTGMPAQRAWTRESVLHRFLGSQSGRKAKYAALFVDAVDLDRAPPPLTALLAHLR